MFEAPKSPYLVSYKGGFDISKSSTEPQTNGHSHKGKHRREATEKLSTLQRVLAAGDRHSVLLVFQAMDAAGKDSTIRSVMQGIDPSGCQVFSFKKPSSLELDHDFLWRTTCRLPERGRMDERLTSIRQQEEHLARNGTVILKFWLNVSKDEQKRRFLARLDDPAKNWKFEPGDVVERRHWDDYMSAYQDALNATSRPWAPWYAIPADDKPYMRARVAEIIINALQGIGLRYPEPSSEDRSEFAEARAELGKND